MVVVVAALQFAGEGFGHPVQHAVGVVSAIFWGMAWGIGVVKGFKGLGVNSWNWIRDNKDFAKDGTPRDHSANGI